MFKVQAAVALENGEIGMSIHSYLENYYGKKIRYECWVRCADAHTKLYTTYDLVDSFRDFTNRLEGYFASKRVYKSYTDKLVQIRLGK